MGNNTRFCALNHSVSNSVGPDHRVEIRKGAEWLAANSSSKNMPLLIICSFDSVCEGGQNEQKQLGTAATTLLFFFLVSSQWQSGVFQPQHCWMGKNSVWRQCRPPQVLRFVCTILPTSYTLDLCQNLSKGGLIVLSDGSSCSREFLRCENVETLHAGCAVASHTFMWTDSGRGSVTVIGFYLIQDSLKSKITWSLNLQGN